MIAIPSRGPLGSWRVVWLLPIVLWVSPRAGNGDGLEAFLPALVTLVLLSVVLARGRSADVVVVPA